MGENDACVANITPAGRRRRMVLGAVVLGASVIGWFVTVAAGEYATKWNLLALLPSAFGWLCLIQALENT